MTPEDLAAIRAESEIEHAPDVCYEDWRRHVMGLLEHIDSQDKEIKRLEDQLANRNRACDMQRDIAEKHAREALEKIRGGKE